MTKKQFPLMLEESQRERFERAAEEHPFADNLTDFFRATAAEEAQALLDDNTNDSDVEEVEVDLTELEEGQAELREKLDTIIDLLEDIDIQTEFDPRVEECATRIIEHLPSAPEEKIKLRDPSNITGDNLDKIRTAGRLHDMVDLLTLEGFEEYTIRRAAAKAEKEITDVHSTTVDGETRYYFWNEEADEAPDPIDGFDDNGGDAE
jgi:uncharacterized protein (DUF1778 family)